MLQRLFPDTPFTLQSLYDATGCAVGAPSCADYTLKVGVEGSTKFQRAGRISNWTQDTNSRAVFYQGTFNLTDSVAITAGARYTEEEKRSHALMDLTTNTTGRCHTEHRRRTGSNRCRFRSWLGS